MMGTPTRWVQLPLDLLLVAIAWWLAFWLRLNSVLVPTRSATSSCP